MKRSLAVWLMVSFSVSLLLAQEERRPVNMPGEEMQKVLIHRVEPVLPPETGMRLHGTVVLRAVIGKSGAIESLQMVSGRPILVPAAFDAVKQWRYRRYEVNGIPVRVETTVDVTFADESEPRAEPSATGSPVSVTADDMRARLVYRAFPVYPPLARQARIQGRVILRIVINQMGEVRDTELVSGHPMLAPAAVEAVKKWRYIPYESDGKAAEVQTEVRVIFSLAGS